MDLDPDRSSPPKKTIVPVTRHFVSPPLHHAALATMTFCILWFCPINSFKVLVGPEQSSEKRHHVKPSYYSGKEEFITHHCVWMVSIAFNEIMA